MTLTRIYPDLSQYPAELQSLLTGPALYDSSCSKEASVVFIDKDEGFFLKSAPGGALAREAEMTRYFHSKGLSAAVGAYISGERDWLLTEKIPGEDSNSQKYLDRPERLCDVIAELIAALHGMDYADCPVPNHTEWFLAEAKRNYLAGNYDDSLFPDNWGFATAEEAYRTVETRGHLLETNTLLHGDCCLPNILLHDWAFTGFIDLDHGGVGDRHIDLFWAMWSLGYNLRTDRYRERFMDAYGRAKFDGERLRIVAAVAVFT